MLVPLSQSFLDLLIFIVFFALAGIGQNFILLVIPHNF